MVAIGRLGALHITVVRGHGVAPRAAIGRCAAAHTALGVLDGDVQPLHGVAAQVPHGVVARLLLRLRRLGQVVLRAGGGLVGGGGHSVIIRHGLAAQARNLSLDLRHLLLGGFARIGVQL